MLQCHVDATRAPLTLALRDFETTAGLVAAQRSGRGTCCANYIQGSCKDAVTCSALHPLWTHVIRLKLTDPSKKMQPTTPNAGGGGLPSAGGGNVAVLVRRTNQTYSIPAELFFPTEHLNVAVRMGSGTACSHHLRETCLNGSACRFLHPREAPLRSTMRAELSPSHPFLVKPAAPAAATPAAVGSPSKGALPSATTPKKASTATSFKEPTTTPAAAVPPPSLAPGAVIGGTGDLAPGGPIELELVDVGVLGSFPVDAFDPTLNSVVRSRSGRAKVCEDLLRASCSAGTQCGYAHPKEAVMRDQLWPHLGLVRRLNLEHHQEHQQLMAAGGGSGGRASTISAGSADEGIGARPGSGFAAQLTPDHQFHHASPPSGSGAPRFGGFSWSANGLPSPGVHGGGSLGIVGGVSHGTPRAILQTTTTTTTTNSAGGHGISGAGPFLGGLLSEHSGMTRRVTDDDEDVDALLDLVHVRPDDDADESAAAAVGGSAPLGADDSLIGNRAPAASYASASGIFRRLDGSGIGGEPNNTQRTPSVGGVSPQMRAAPLNTSSGGLFGASLTNTTALVAAAGGSVTLGTPPAVGKLPSPMLRPSAFSSSALPPPLPVPDTSSTTPDPWAVPSAVGGGAGGPGGGGVGAFDLDAPHDPYAEYYAAMYASGPNGASWSASAPPPYDYAHHQHHGTPGGHPGDPTGQGMSAMMLPPVGGPIAVTAESKEIYHIDRNDFELTRNLAATIRIGSGIACSHHLRDRCNNGSTCRFLHPVERVLATTLRTELGRNHPVLRAGSTAATTGAAATGTPGRAGRFSSAHNTPSTLAEGGELPVPKSRQTVTDAVAEAAAVRALQAVEAAPALPSTDNDTARPQAPSGAWAARSARQPPPATAKPASPFGGSSGGAASARGGGGGSLGNATAGPWARFAADNPPPPRTTPPAGPVAPPSAPVISGGSRQEGDGHAPRNILGGALGGGFTAPVRSPGPSTPQTTFAGSAVGRSPPAASQQVPLPKSLQQQQQAAAAAAATAATGSHTAARERCRRRNARSTSGIIASERPRCRVLGAGLSVERSRRNRQRTGRRDARRPSQGARGAGGRTRGAATLPQRSPAAPAAAASSLRVGAAGPRALLRLRRRHGVCWRRDSGLRTRPVPRVHQQGRTRQRQEARAVPMLRQVHRGHRIRRPRRAPRQVHALRLERPAQRCEAARLPASRDPRGGCDGKPRQRRQKGRGQDGHDAAVGTLPTPVTPSGPPSPRPRRPRCCR
jgi:hypothetical protein